LGTPERDAWYQWIVYLSNSLAATYRFWFYPADLGSPEHTPEVRAALQRKIESVWDRLDAHLAANGPYLLGENFSAADLLLIMLMRWSRNMPRSALEWPALKEFATRMRARASWKKMYEVEGLTEWA
jgi:glutathione S-transferase